MNFNSKLSAIHYGTSPSTFSRYLPVFVEMLKSYDTPICMTEPPIPTDQPSSDCFNTDLDLSDMLLSCARESGHNISNQESNALSSIMRQDSATSAMIIGNMD